MELSLAITLRENAELSYSVMPEALVHATMGDLILAGPRKLSFSPFSWVALRGGGWGIEGNLPINKALPVSWSFSIVDDMEGRPLLEGKSGMRALLLMGEIIQGLYEGFETFGLNVLSLKPCVTTNVITIDYVIPPSRSALEALGIAGCLAGVIDSLLFARGLTVRAPQVIMLDRDGFAQKDFVSLYQGVLTRAFYGNV